MPATRTAATAALAAFVVVARGAGGPFGALDLRFVLHRFRSEVFFFLQRGEVGVVVLVDGGCLELGAGHGAIAAALDRHARAAEGEMYRWAAERLRELRG